jgi:hypothetical protein
METILMAALAFRELMKNARKRSLLAPPEEAQMTTNYLDEKPKGLQIDWIARKLGIEPSKPQAEFCSESNWPIWPIDHFETRGTNLDASVIDELRNHGMVPVLAEQTRTRGNERRGYITVLAEHGLVAPMALAIYRKHRRHRRWLSWDWRRPRRWCNPCRWQRAELIGVISLWFGREVGFRSATVTLGLAVLIRVFLSSVSPSVGVARRFLTQAIVVIITQWIVAHVAVQIYSAHCAIVVVAIIHFKFSRRVSA